MWNRTPSFRFAIDNFSEKEAAIASPIFVSGGCEWLVYVYPNGAHLTLFLSVGNSQSLQSGWQRSISYYFVLLNQSDKELYRSGMLGGGRLFCAEHPDWRLRTTLPLSKFQEKGFLEMDRLIVEVYIYIHQAIDGGGDVSRKETTVNINGFQVFASQVTSVRKLFVEHPDIAEDFKPRNQVVKTEYMNVLLNLIEILDKSPKSLPETKLSKASSDLSELMHAGFKLDWLKSKLEEDYLHRKISDDADGSRIQQLEGRIKDLELVQSGIKLEILKSKIEEISLERKKSDDADGSRVEKIEERVSNLELMGLDLNSKLEEDSLERKISDDADRSRIQQHEERIKSLEMMMSDLKVGMDKKKANSCADGFLLVDEDDGLM